ncbi:DNA polymerase I [Erysipelothrix sp. HDW6A]|uniref:DNA polymerase I n=1 Tax=Erysipelothrix sp. HDW6A TaxID=2714928 RepID=UPI00140E459A|nr:DNA polymerase I [Erysipelothrix sp. HDW6A]QIK57414.1 DNA polymerase I [Erysipelothrix sp. HDW6A]
MKDLLLIDGNSMLFRAYYGTLSRGTMKSSEGVVTNAVYGFSTMLTKAIEKYKPDHILVAFDTGVKTFRHDMFDNYKGTRKEVDPELVSQFALVREFLDSYPIKRYEIDGFEADDIIGTIAHKFEDTKTYILTSDRDMLQLIDKNVDVLLMRKGLTDIKHMDVAALQEDTGLTPSQIVDVKALQGDTSDNIPGVPSIGEKTAIKLIKEYGTFENLYEHKEDIKGKMGENLRNFEDQAKMSYDLALIHREVPNNIDLSDIVYQDPTLTLNAFYRKYDMNSLIVNVGIEDNEVVEKKHTFELEEFGSSWVHKTTMMMLDYDKKGNIQGVYLTDSEAYAYLTYPEMTLNPLFKLCLERDKPHVFLSSKGIYRFALENNINIKHTIDDILLLAFIVDPSINTSDILRDTYQLWYPEYEGLENGCAVLKGLGKLYPNLIKQAEKDNVYSVYETIEKPLVPVLAKCEYLGVTVDRSVLDTIAEKTHKKLEALSNQIYGFANKEFNINSPKQLSEVLFDDLGLKTGKKRSTAVSVLEGLIDKHPIIEPILSYRKYQKLYSTYAVGLTKHIKEDGKIHTNFNQHATQTGRLSSSDPNMQNISVRDEETREVRAAFVASAGRKLVSIDYSQIELRVLSFLANEEKMIDAFKHNEDIHTSTAKQIFGVDAINSNMRRQAKSVNFGIVYGISAFGLANQIDVGIDEASHFIDRYNDVYPNILKYMKHIVDDALENGYVTTYFGRRRYIPELNDKNRAVKEFGKRAAMNAPIQGTAADIIKLAMIAVDKALTENNFKSSMILQVHDELVFDVYEDELENLVKLVEDIMKNIVDWPVPLDVSTSIGDNWME